MGNRLGLWSKTSPELRVIQSHHNDLQEVIIYPLAVASKLLQEGVVSRTLVSEVSTIGRSPLQNSTAIITAVTASIHSKPDQFQVFMSVLEERPESANLARKMRNELSEYSRSELQGYSTERLMERKGWWYTVSAEYKNDFIRLQADYGQLFRIIRMTVKTQVLVGDLKEYLCENFDEFTVLLQEANTTDDVMKVVRNQSSLTDLAYFHRINNHFDLQVTQEINKYCKKLDSFCQHTLDNHSYVRSFREDYSRYILSSDRVTFKLQWEANQKTLKDIRDVLQMSFRHLADRVQIMVVKAGSVVIVCCAPQFLMEELVRLASESADSLAELGVVKLTIGGIEVIEKEPWQSPTSSAAPPLGLKMSSSIASSDHYQVFETRMTTTTRVDDLPQFYCEAESCSNPEMVKCLYVSGISLLKGQITV